jgi:tetratricopeptide (TPR) repeat protein
LKAAAMYQKILDGKPSDINGRMQLAQCYFNLADFSRTQGDLNAALDYNRKSIPLVESVVHDEPGEPKHQVQFWGANYNLALTLYQMGNAAEVIETARKVLPVAESLRANNPTGTDKYNYLRPQQTRAVIAESLNYTGDYQSAVKEFAATVALCEAELVLQPNETIITRNLAITHRRMASALVNAGDTESAFEHLKISASTLEKLVTENAKNYDFPTYLAHTEIATGQLLLRQNQAGKAAERFRRALELNETVLAADAQRGQNRADAAQARANLGYALALNGKPEEGLNYLHEAVAFYEQINAAASPDAHIKRSYAETLLQTGTILERENNHSISETRELFRRSSDLWKDLQTRGVMRHADYAQTQAVASRLSQL